MEQANPDKRVALRAPIDGCRKLQDTPSGRRASSIARAGWNRQVSVDVKLFARNTRWSAR